MTSPGSPAAPAGEGTRLVWILRHAKAVADPPPGGDDHDRPLAPKGRRDAAALGARLAEGTLGLPPGWLPAVALCSTATRTVQTAEAVLSGILVPIDRRRRLYYGSPTDVLDELRTLDDAAGSAMVVGHNPAAYALAVEMLSAADADGRQRIEDRGFPTCALAVVRTPAVRWTDLASGSGTLAGYFTPRY